MQLIMTFPVQSPMPLTCSLDKLIAARTTLHRTLVVALALAVTACVTRKSQEAQSVSDLSGVAVEVSAAQAQKNDDYSSIHMSDPNFVRHLDGNLSRRGSTTGAEFVANILAYEETQRSSVIISEFTRAIYTYKAQDIRNCSNGQPNVPLKSAKNTGAQYLAYLFFEDVGFQKVDGVLLAGGELVGPQESTTYEAAPPDQKIDEVTHVQERSGAGMFCDPLDLKNIVPELREQADTHPYLYGNGLNIINEGGEAIKVSRSAKGQYLPVPIWGLLKQELAELTLWAPAQAESLASYKLVVDYGTDNFSMGAQQDGKRIVISAVLVRHVLLSLALEQQDSLAQLEIDMTSGKLGKASIERNIRSLARETREKVREHFSLALAHELAHMYLGKGGRLEFNEDRVDCFALANVYKARGAIPMGVVGWLDSDVDGEAKRFWAVDDQRGLNEVKTRVKKIRSWAETVLLDQDFVRHSCQS